MGSKSLAGLLLLLLAGAAGAQGGLPGLSEEIYGKLTGVWAESPPQNGSVERFSWGVGETAPGAITIDLGAAPALYQEQDVRFHILSVRRMLGNRIVLNLQFVSSEPGWEARRIVHVNRDGTIWFEGVGESVSYARIAGPGIVVQGVCNDTRVRVRSAPTLQADILGHLDRGQEVRILDRTAEKMKIQEMDDYWYRIDTGELKGWSYGHFIDVR